VRIGELLLQHGWVTWAALYVALDDHRAAGLRIASFLVARGGVEFDHASQALAEQTGVAAALRRHIERRDRTAPRSLPVELARRLCALPLGRHPTGPLIVCVRDPSPAVQAELAQVAGEVALAVAPAAYLERLVERAYPAGTSGEIPLDTEVEAELAEDLDDEIDDLVDDIDVDIPIEVAEAVYKTLPVKKLVAVAQGAPDPLDACVAACRDIDEVSWLFDVVMAYVEKRWHSSALFDPESRRIRGHGTALAADAPDSVPLMKGGQTAYLLVVGEPIERDPDDTASDLAVLAEAASEALART
jgi:hypothetical protein